MPGKHETVRQWIERYSVKPTFAFTQWEADGMTISGTQICLVVAMIVAGIVFLNNQARAENPEYLQPPFGSTADTVFDIIQASDPSTFTCLTYIGREERQIWDKRVEDEPVVDTFVFVSQYSDGTTIQIALNPEFGTVEAAREEAMRYVKPLGQLPTVLRKGVRRPQYSQRARGFSRRY